MDTELTAQELIARLSASDNPDEVKALYHQWAERYDSDLEIQGYIAPQLAVDAFCRLLDGIASRATATVYDAGCGTGQVAILLRGEGIELIDGADFSDDMLEVARSSGSYRSLANTDYSKPVAVADRQYDAVISVGVYTHHFENQFLPEMCRILKPGGLLYFTCRPYYFQKFAATELIQLLNEKKISSLHIERKPYIVKEQADAFYISAFVEDNE
ncbi:MAG: methyltransferase domain-containing protein [Pseudomonadota bacterium]